MEPVVNTKDTIDVNSTSTQGADLGNKFIHTSLGMIALEYKDFDIEVKETMLDIEKPENTAEIVFSHVQKDSSVNVQIDAQKDTQKNIPIDTQKDTQIDTQEDTQIDAQNNTQIDAQNDTQIDVQNLHQYRSKVNEVSPNNSSDSSDSESDSSSSSSSSSISSSDSSSSSDSDSNNSDDNNDNRKKEKKKTNIFKQVPVQSELNGLPPVEDLKISVPEVKCDLFGETIGMVEELIIIKPKADKPALREETILFMQRGQKALGKIFDVFGPVKEPYYTIRFNSVEHVQEKGITVGMPVYYCPNSKFTFPVFLSEIMKMKPCDPNCDGSGGEHPDFSDDEEEKRYYEKMYRQRKYNTQMVQNRHQNSDGDVQSTKRICMSNTSHTLTNSTSSTFTSRASTPSTSTSNSRNYQSQRRNEYRHWPAWRNNNQFNRANQFNAYRPPQDNSRNASFMYNTPPPYQGRYVAPPQSSSPQQYVNYNLTDSNYGNQYYPGANTSTQYGYVPQHSDPSYSGYPPFNPPFYNHNHSNPQYTRSLWPRMSLPPPPPPPPPPSSSLLSPNNSTNN